MERAFWLLDFGHPFNGVFVVSLCGPLEEALLYAVLRRWEQRHPLLRVRIESIAKDDQRALRMTDQNVGPIPLRIASRKGDRTWQAIAAQELNCRFAEDSDHLTRVVWVRGASHSELLFVQHHVIGDALSMTYAVRDLLIDLAAFFQNKTLPAPAALPARPALPALLPASARGLRRFLYMQSFFYKHVLARPLRRARKLPMDEIAAPPLRRSAVVQRFVATDLTSRIVKRARQEGTTVHAALCAALLMTAAEEFFAEQAARGRGVRLGCASAVNLRRELQPPVEQEMGLYVSQVTTFHRVMPSASLWTLAHQVKQQLGQTLKHGEQYLTLPLIGMFIPYGRHPGPGFIRRFDGGSPAALAVTNIGELPIAPSYGPFAIKSCQFLVSPSVVTPLIITASTFGGALFLNLVHVEPLCSARRAKALLDGAITRLRTACLVGGAQAVA